MSVSKLTNDLLMKVLGAVLTNDLESNP